jgi:hypothetical protein
MGSVKRCSPESQTAIAGSVMRSALAARTANVFELPLLLEELDDVPVEEPPDENASWPVMRSYAFLF